MKKVVFKTHKGKIEKLERVTRDAVACLLYYDRKECEELSREDVEYLLESGEVKLLDIANWFTDELKEKASINFNIPEQGN